MPNPKTKVPTARELIAAKKAATPKTAVAVPDARPYSDRYLDEISPSDLVGRLVKFKDGAFITADDEQEIPETAAFTALCDQTLVGWVKFNGEGPPDKVMGLLYGDDNFQM